MKVWELMAELSKRPAGDDVWVGHNMESTCVESDHVDTDSEGVITIYGRGRIAVDDDE